MKLFRVLLVIFVSAISASSSNTGTPPRRFTSQPQSGSPEVLGNTKVLVCDADGVPVPSYRWIRDGQLLTTPKSAFEGALKIRNVERKNAGRYQCVATNARGALLSNSAFIHVAFMKPFANHASPEQYVSLGQALVIDLPPIDCYPAPSIEWFEGNNVLVSREHSFYHVTMKNQLVILEVQQKLDNKVYKAKATNIYSKQTSDSQLFVVKIQNVGNGAVGDVPLQIIVPPSNTTVVADSDESAQLECVVSARPLSSVVIRWLRLDPATGFAEAINADGAKYLKSTFERVLTILNPDPSDAGVYRCEGSSRRPGGGDPVTADATLTVYVKPTFLMPAYAEVSIEVEASVTLSCEVSGLPLPSIQWHHDAKPLRDPLKPRYSVLENGSLVIMNATGDDSGVYQCFAVNVAGEINSVTVVDVMSHAPVILTVPYNRTVVSGDRVNLPCLSSGAPRPTVTWSRVAVAMATRQPVGTSRVLQNDLTFDRVELTDAGVYTCVAANDRGSVAMDVHLNVAIRTRIITTSQDLTVHRGLAVMLPCEVVNDARFPVSWHWLFNGVNLDMTDIRQRQRMPDGSLHIRSSDRSDIGVYVCHVVSVGGNDSTTARLNVVELPQPPRITSLTLSAMSETSADLRWMAPTFDGNSEIRRFVIYFRILSRENEHYRPLQGVTDDDQWQVIGHAEGRYSTEYTMHHLQPSQSYQFCVSAVNEVGEGRRSAPSSVLTIPHQVPSAPPRGVFGTSRSESSIIIQWQSPEKSRWNGPLLGYQISYKLAGYPDSTLRNRNITNASKTVAEIDELEPFQEYDISVAAYNLKGVGVFSDFTRVRTSEGRPAAPPVDVNAQPINSTAIGVSWTPPHQRHINGINLGYRVTAVPDDGAVDAKEVTSVVGLNMSNMVGRQMWVLASLDKYTKYLITISCFTSKGDGPKSRPVAVQTLEDVPDRIGSLTPGNKIDSQLEIFWTPPLRPNGVITGYVVKCREMNQSSWLLEVEMPPRSVNFTLTQLVAHKSYYVDVAAKTRIGIGASYVVIIESGVAPEKPDTPRDISVKNINPTSVELQLSSESAQSPAALVRWIVEGQSRDPLSSGQWSQLPVNSSSADRSLVVSGLSPDTEYRLRVSAENSAGRSNASGPTEWFRTAASVPSFPPERMVVRVLNATAFMATWTPLSRSHWNGRGRHYALRYRTCAAADSESRIVETDGDESVDAAVGFLEEWTSYCVRIAACNELGCSEFGPLEAIRTMESVPSVGPADVTAETLNCTSIRVTWSPIPEIHENGRILGYKVKYRSTLESSDAVVTLWGDWQTSVVLVDLQKFTWYQIAVIAFTRIGDGATSFPVATTQTLEDVPGAPSGVYFPTVNESSVRLAWLPPSQPNGMITGYRVEYRIKAIDPSHPEPSLIDESLGKDRNGYVATGLRSNVFYTFTVKARTRLGWGEAARVDVSTGGTRKVPGRPNRPMIGPSQIGDRWIIMTLLPDAASQSPIRNYTIQVKVNDGQFLTHKEILPIDANEFNISGLMPGTRYRIRLAASSDVGTSEFSNESDVVQTHFSIPDSPPVDVVLSQQSLTSILVKWKPPKDETAWNGIKFGYRIWFRQLDHHDDKLRNGGGRNYDRNEYAYRSVDTIYPSTNIPLSNLVPKSMFEVKVALVNSIGHGPMSLPVDVMLGEAVPTEIPQNLKAFPLDSASIRVTWTKISAADDEFENCLGYKIFYWIVGSRGNTTRVKHASLSEGQTVVNGLKMFTRYAFVVAAFGAGGSGPNSSVPVEATTEDDLPGHPERLTIYITSQNSVNLTWQRPAEPNGLIEGYELTYFQETLVGGESKSVRVSLSGEKTSYHARDLTPEASYMFRIAAKTRHGLGPESSRSFSIGSKTGSSPTSPGNPRCLESSEGIVIAWNASDPGSSPIIAYIVEYRQTDVDLASHDWLSIRNDLSPLESEVTISSDRLVPGARYQFRVFAVNSQGISLPSSTVEYVSEGDIAHTQSVTASLFYQRWWFLVMIGIAGVVAIVAVVAGLCISGRRRAKITSKGKPWKRKISESKPLPPPFSSIDDETGFATIERRHPQLWGNQRYPKATTLPLYTRAPPRPSPGSIQYDTDLISEHEDSGNVSDKASQNGDSDPETEVNHLASFLNHSSKRPQSLHGAAAISDAPAYTISLNGGHSVTPKYHTMRPTKLSSFI